MEAEKSVIVTIRHAKRTDCTAIMKLKEELAIHQNMKGRPMLSPQSKKNVDIHLKKMII